MFSSRSIKDHLPRWLNASMIFILLFTLAASSTSISQAQSNLPDPARPATVPSILVNAGTVTDFSRVSTVLMWHSEGSCYTPTQTPSTGAPALGDVLETVTRVSVIYASPSHTLYSRDIRATNACNPYVFSKVVYDGANAYWVDATGLVTLSKDANLGDTPTIINASFNDQQPYSIAVDSQYVYLSRASYGGGCGLLCFPTPAIMEKVNKTTGAITGLDCQVLLGCPYGVDLQVDPGGRYLYYIDASGGLEQMNLSSPTSIVKLASNVTSYYPEGQRIILCTLSGCVSSDYIFIAHGLTAAGQTHEIIRYDNTPSVNPKSTVIYSSTWGQDVSINDLVVDSNEIFFNEMRENICVGCLINTYTAWLFRSGRANSTSLANIYQSTASYSSVSSAINLDTDGAKVYWIESGNILSLSDQATALPKYAMEITGIEVTQGVQTLNNSVQLIANKDTFVRVYVKSDGTTDVPGITARLKASVNGAPYTDWIEPTNALAVTVKRTPSRSNLNDGFLFELPWSWVNGATLLLTAELNPSHDPEQTDNYANNIKSTGLFVMNTSPRLEIRFFEYYYTMGDTTFGPGPTEGAGNVDWIQRAYPLDQTLGNISDPGTGLKVNFTTITDDGLANLVRYPSLPCEDKDTTQYPDPTKADCQNLRASAYAASLEASLRDSYKTYDGDTDNTTYYGLIAEGSEMRYGNYVTYFPRGQDGGKNGAGPAGPDYLGEYAAHEVGHSIGLMHPATANGQCGIKGSDSIPTYPNGQIGSNDDATNAQGFLGIAAEFSYPPYANSNILLGSQTYDMMAYCTPNWISDQNYARIYQNLTGAPMLTPVSVKTSGDWLSVYGGIYTGSNSASVDILQHVVGNMTIPPITAGAYAIRLLDISHTKLADYAFTPAGDAESPLLLYGQVVAFVPNTRFLQIVRLSDQAVLVEKSISAHSPTVSNVALTNPPSPVAGTVTLTWSAQDQDNLPLFFNILYSQNGGTSFIPLVTHVTGTSRAIDTSTIGGGVTIFQVVASDGANTGSANSIAYTLANKPPVVTITLPAATVHVHYGQVVNFSGMAQDVKDSILADSQLVWTEGTTTLGTGRLMTQSLLPMGDNAITLTATNSQTLTGTAVVHVIVDDNVEPDGPTMQVTPGGVHWSIAVGNTAQQSMGMTVSNFGTGSFSWNVASDSAWLTVSTSSGADGATLTAYGMPGVMTNGQVRTGKLTFTTTVNGVLQTVIVPVTLSAGSPFQSPDTGPQNSYFFLPTIKH